MKLNFVKLSPSKNTTILITDFVDPKHYVEVANKTMSYEYLNAEQVGFIKKSKDPKSVLRFEMPGGEFCGDGLMSAAVLARWMGYCGENEFQLESSGVNNPVNCKVECINENVYKSKITVPADFKISDYSIKYKDKKIEGQLVILPGISHYIVKNQDNSYGSKLITGIIKCLAKEIDAKAIGVIPYHINSGNAAIKPCIHVPETGKLLFESGCGSGTMALGICLAEKKNCAVSMDIIQPGGVIHIDVDFEDGGNNDSKMIKMISLETDIGITCKGQIYI